MRAWRIKHHRIFQKVSSAGPTEHKHMLTTYTQNQFLTHPPFPLRKVCITLKDKKPKHTSGTDFTKTNVNHFFKNRSYETSYDFEARNVFLCSYNNNSFLVIVNLSYCKKISNADNRSIFKLVWSHYQTTSFKKLCFY